MINQQQFTSLTGIVIDNFEGGYYHPDMLNNFKPSDQAKLAGSGETMFGLDRKAGASLAKYPEWKMFWDLVDAARKSNPADWKYQSRGGAAGPTLKALAATIMYRWFTELCTRYINLDSIKAIGNDDRLIIHFSYASWNGEGWFKKYADALKNAIAQFGTDTNKVFFEAFKARSEAVTVKKDGTKVPNLVIRQQADNMMKLFKSMRLV